ncbi:MAG TPA: AmmeMemoRadiSam system protein A [Candidatus Limiplasma sp.]|nr:AmmeMemoRadiSam system protein A [Candidatus Limiplasma sp.]
MSIAGAVMMPHPPLIIPQVGRGQEKGIVSTVAAMETAARFMAELTPETIVVISPHATAYVDYIHISPGTGAAGSFARFGAPQVRIEADYDDEFVRALSALCALRGLAAGTDGEREPALDHGTMIPLYFIQKAIKEEQLKLAQQHKDKVRFEETTPPENAKHAGEPEQPETIPQPMVVRIGISGLPTEDHYRLGMLIRQTADELDRRVAIAASGDLSHKLKADGPYGLSPEGKVYDVKIMAAMGSGAFGALFDFPQSLCTSAAECGHRSFVMMAGAFDGVQVQAEKLSYEGPFGVGYGVCTFRAGKADPARCFLVAHRQEVRQKVTDMQKNEDPYVRLARQSFTAWVMRREHIAAPVETPPELLTRRAGVFVSLHKAGQLRGCIGTISPTQKNIAEEIIQNAISACAQDPRFSPVRPAELPEIECSVDVLGGAEDIASMAELDPQRYGVIVTSGRKRGLLLPALDGVDTAREQIAIARRKAGISADEKISLQRFEVVRHH